MTAEDSKQPSTKVVPSSNGTTSTEPSDTSQRSDSRRRGEAPIKTATEERDAKSNVAETRLSYRPKAKSVAEIETDDTWGDSEIDAALGVLDAGLVEPKSIPSNPGGREKLPSTDDEATHYYDRSALGLPSSKPPSATGLPSSKPPPATGLPSSKPPPATGLSSSKSPPATGLSSSKPPPATGLSSSKPPSATGLPSSKPPPATGLSSSKSPTVLDDDEATKYYDKSSLGIETHSPATSAQTDEATQHYDRASYGIDLSQAIATNARDTFAPGITATSEPSTTTGSGMGAKGPASVKREAKAFPQSVVRSSPPRPGSAPMLGISTPDVTTTAPASSDKIVEAPISSGGETRLVMEGANHPRSVGGPLAVAASSVEPVATEASNATEQASEAAPLSEVSSPAPAPERDNSIVPGLTGVSAFSIAPRPGSPGFENEVWLDPLYVRAWRRIVRSFASAVTVVLGLSVIDAGFALRSSVDKPRFWNLYVASLGLSVPTAIVVALLVGAATVLLHPDNSPSLRGLRLRLRPTDVRRRARLAILLLAVPPAISVWLLFVGQAALRALGTEGSNRAIGFVISAMAFGLAIIFAVPVLAVARYMGVRLRQAAPDPIRYGVVGLVLGVFIIGAAIFTGETSGSGGIFGLWGVFKRPELDLRLPTFLLCLAIAAYWGQSLVRRVNLGVLFVVGLMPLGLTYRAASRGLSVRQVALAIERDAPLGRLTLGPFRKWTDRDHDGFSARFGGGDCNDRDPKINPRAEDIPINGIDEDCSGRDAEPVTLGTVVSTPTDVLQARKKSIPSPLNVIVFSIDTLRADVIGHERHVVPHLDTLAAEGVVFENAYAPASYTGKSVGPIFIGKHSSETNRDFSHFNAFAKGKDVFVQQRLQAAKIRTISAQGYWYFYQPTYGFEQGFDVVDSSASAGTGYVEGDRTTTSERLANAVLEQLQKPENIEKQFYLWAHFTDPHVEYVSHEGFDFGSTSKERYYGEAAFVDHHVGRIVDWVRTQPWSNRTAIVVTSDHGEAFGEHGMIRHGFELWEPLVKVPFILAVPGIEPRRIVARRSVLDLVPTLLDLMQVAPPTGIDTDFVSGHSLLPEMLGIEGTDVPRPFLVDMALGPYNAERQAYFHGDLKLITSDSRPLGLYDVKTDPEEKKDLLDDTALKEKILGEYRAFKKSMRIVIVKGKSR